jgi:hypothetical protein
MTLRRLTSLALATCLAYAGLATAPAASATPAPATAAPPVAESSPALVVPDVAEPMQPDHLPPGTRLGSPVPTSDLLAAAGVPASAPSPAAGTLRGLSVADRSELQPTPPGRPGLRGLVEHVAPSCSGTGRDGNRVQVVYAVEQGQHDRYVILQSALQSFVADVDDTFALSSRESGRRVRWVSDSACTPAIDHVVLPKGALSEPDMVVMKTALRELGYDEPGRKYLVLADAGELCGIGDVYRDDRPTQNNRNNGTAPMYARVDTPCWAVPPGGHSTPAHELMHMLGAVQPTAPHATAYGHCTDERDAMCYADGDGQRLRRVCAQPDDEQLFDCRRDDYFDPSPTPASAYLREHWNTADSRFLDRISVARNAIGLPPEATMSAPARLRPGLGATLSVLADRPVVVRWTSSQPVCLPNGTTGARVRLQCPTDVRGAVTVLATVTGADGTVTRVSSRVLLSAGSAAMGVSMVAPGEVAVGESAPLVVDVRYKRGTVKSAVALQQYAGRTRGWVTLDVTTTGPDGHAEFSVRRTASGLRTYRALVLSAEGSGWESSHSSSVLVDVV